MCLNLKILKEIYAKDCFDGNFIKEYKLNKKVDLNFINFLKNFGKIVLLKNLKLPFYSFDKKYFFTIKGLIGKDEMKVIFRRNNINQSSKLLKTILNNCKKKNGLKCTKEIEVELMQKIMG